MSVNKYSTTPGSNLTVGDGADAVGLQEGMPRADVNNAMRTILADQAKAYIDGAGIVTTGTGSAYLVTTSSDYTAYTAGMNIVVQLHADALVNATVNVNSLGARTLKMRGATGLVNWSAGIAKAGDYVELFYNGTSFYAAGVGSAPVNNGTHTGTTTVGSLVATTADINAGTIDGTVIGATTPAAATFTTADINGGTIDGATVGATAASTGKFTTLQSTGLATLATTDINGGAIDGTVIGATTPAAGTFTTILGNGSGISGIVAGITFYRKTANYTAVHQDGVIADTTAGTFTVTLPASPATGDYVVISDGGSWATTNLTVGRNGKTIEGDAADMTMDLGGVHVTFVYDGFTWQIYVTGAYPSKGIVDNATSTAITIDASGNIGVGRVPTVVEAAYDGLQLGAGGTWLSGSSNLAAGNFGQNYYIDAAGADRYLGNDEAERISMNNGSISFESAPTNASGAGAALTWTERLRINASGNVGIGTASPTYKFEVSDGTRTAIITPNATLDGVFVGTKEAKPLVFGTTDTERMRIDASGNIWSGGASMPQGYAGKVNIIGGIDLVATHVGSSLAKTHFLFNNPNGTVGMIRTTGTSTAFVTSSDYRLKENITPIQGAADIVKAMRPCTYTFKADGEWVDGFIAHELQELHPVAVSGSKDEVDEEGNPVYQGVDYSKLTPILTAALQEALNKIDALTARIDTLEAK